METTSSKAIETLNDLIEINKDRVAGFEKASRDLDESNSDLRGIFNQLASESRNNASELTNAVNRHGPEAETGSSAMGPSTALGAMSKRHLAAPTARVS